MSDSTPFVIELLFLCHLSFQVCVCLSMNLNVRQSERERMRERIREEGGERVILIVQV